MQELVIKFLQNFAGAYSTFANGGVFGEAKFVSFITDKDNKLVYVHKAEEENVLRDDASFMINDMLKTCATSGTAKRLAGLECEIASKTGTVGKPGSKLNLDAWNVSYTRDCTCGVWFGNLDNTPISYAGGNQPTEVAKRFFGAIEDSSVFEKPASIVEREIDLIEMEENHRVVLANNFTPERFKVYELFSMFNLPSDVSSKWAKLDKPEFKTVVEDNRVLMTINCKNYIEYDIYQGSLKESDKVYSISGKDGKQNVSLMLPENKEKFFIVSRYIGMNDNENVFDFEVIRTAKKVIKEKWNI